MAITSPTGIRPIIVIINGILGAGKLSILKIVKERLENQCKSSSVFLLGNHTLIDPVQAAVNTTQCAAKNRQLAFGVIAEQIARVEERNIYLMTACLAESNDIDAGCLQEYFDLMCDTTVTLEGHRTKLTDQKSEDLV